MHHFVVKFSIFFRLRRQGGIDPNQNPAEALGVGAVFQNTFYVFFQISRARFTFFTAQRYASVVCVMALCLSVRPSVTSRYCIETTGRTEMVWSTSPTVDEPC